MFLRHCLWFVAVAAMTTACHRTLEEERREALARVGAAEIEMRSASGALLGTLRLSTAGDGLVRITGSLNGIPAGRHGIHVHAIGRCDGPTFESAGGHFNPTGRKHGLNNPDGPHAGDAPNIQADAAQRAVVDVAIAGGSSTVSSALHDADGSAVVIHAQEDDQATDPSGNSGGRIACGILRRT